MFKNILLVIVLLLLGLSFWLIPNFQEIAAGVAILLFGMISLENGFKSFAEGPLKRLLAKATDKFYKSFSVGFISTAILQSSSLISVITISFLSAGLITLYQGLGIIYGASLGTTTTAWLVATLGLKLKISALALPMIVFGVVLYLQSKRTLKGLGNILAGLGFFFFGIAIMKSGFEAYQGSIDMTSHSLEGILGDLAFVLIGITMTVILQSSSATITIILIILAAGQINYVNAMALTIGANVGTTITAIIAALASNIDGKRIAVAHFLFKFITGLVAFLFLKELFWLVDQTANLLQIDQQDFALKLAIFHTIFNLLGVIMISPFARLQVNLLTRYIHKKQDDQNQPKYLNESALAYPQASLNVMLKETEHLFEVCFEAIAHGLGLSRISVLSKNYKKAISRQGSIKHSDTDVDEIYYNRIKNLYGEIIKFGTRAQKRYTEPKYFMALNNIMEANRYFVEVLKDVKDLQPNMLEYCDSSNDIMKEEYNKLRKRIAKIIRIVFEYQEFKTTAPTSPTETGPLLEQINKERQTLDQYVEKSKSKDILYNGALSKLISQKAIDSNMVTSLINDNRVANSIIKHLIKAAELLYLNINVILIEQLDEIDEESG
jgi:phosphate:Na+ symporter